MSSNVTLLGVHTTPITLQIAAPTSTSQPTRAPVLGSMPSIGSASDEVASCSGPADLSDAGTSDAMLSTLLGKGPAHGPGYGTYPVALVAGDVDPQATATSITAIDRPRDR